MPNKSHFRKLTIGISRCLLGDNVRYDGRNKRNDMIFSTLSRFFNFQAFCPEVAIGLGVPRPAIQLVEQKEKSIHIVEVNSNNNDHTELLQQYANRVAVSTDFSSISGFIFKKNSPSCGMSDVNVYNFGGEFLHKKGVGVFAHAIKEQHPLLPVVDEAYLEDIALREKFLARVYAYHHALRSD